MRLYNDASQSFSGDSSWTVARGHHVRPRWSGRADRGSLTWLGKDWAAAASPTIQTASLTMSTDATGLITRHIYDISGRRVATLTAALAQERYAYDQAGTTHLHPAPRKPS